MHYLQYAITLDYQQAIMQTSLALSSALSSHRSGGTLQGGLYFRLNVPFIMQYIWYWLHELFLNFCHIIVAVAQHPVVTVRLVN